MQGPTLARVDCGCCQKTPAETLFEANQTHLLRTEISFDSFWWYRAMARKQTGTLLLSPIPRQPKGGRKDRNIELRSL